MSIAFFNSFSQTIFLKESGTNSIVPYGTVFNVNSKRWFISDSLGIVNIPKNFDEISLKINSTGYQVKNVTVFRDTTIFLDKVFFLLPDVIVSDKTPSYKAYTSNNKRIQESGSYRWNNEKFINFGSVISFNDSLSKLNKVTFSAKIEGNSNNKITRLKLFKLDKNLQSIQNKSFNTGFIEIYSYELKNTFHVSNEKYLTFILPSNILIEKGTYLVCFQMIPNESDSIRLLGSTDKNAQSYYNFKNDFWIPYQSQYKKGFLNMKISVEYQSY